MSKVTNATLDATVAAYGSNKKVRPDRERLRAALEVAVAVAFAEGYRKGSASAEYDDTNASRP